MAKSQMQEAIIIKWLILKSTIEYLGEWEILYNTNFNYTEFGIIKNAVGSNNFRKHQFCIYSSRIKTAGSPRAVK